jgi:hypothetical protein
MVDGLQSRTDAIPVEVMSDSHFGYDHPLRVNVLTEKQVIANAFTIKHGEGE